jgi:hypothetical protein
VDQSLKDRSKTTYVDYLFGDIAIICAELFQDDQLAEKYLGKMSIPFEKAVVFDRMDEKRGHHRLNRLQNLKRAPQVSKVIERMLTICEDMIQEITILSLDELSELGTVLTMHAADMPDFYTLLARQIGTLITQAELAQLYEDQENLKSTFHACHEMQAPTS